MSTRQLAISFGVGFCANLCIIIIVMSSILDGIAFRLGLSRTGSTVVVTPASGAIVESGQVVLHSRSSFGLAKSETLDPFVVEALVDRRVLWLDPNVAAEIRRIAIARPAPRHPYRVTFDYGWPFGCVRATSTVSTPPSVDLPAEQAEVVVLARRSAFDPWQLRSEILAFPSMHPFQTAPRWTILIGGLLLNMIVLGAPYLVIAEFRRLSVRAIRRRRGRCVHCGYDRRGWQVPVVCPECGRQ